MFHLITGPQTWTSGHFVVAEDQPQLLHPGAAADVCMKTGYADFITWTPRQTVIFCVQRDEDFICKAVDTISHFWARHIYPQLVGTSVPETELELQEIEVESTDSAVPDTGQEVQGLHKAGSGPSRMWNLRFRTPITCSVKYQ
ncbi:hypothetical protein ANANG_G00248060 [Anguilla anguilla]|uniref:Uncharacterized protein n=1 Tax=Anguilla anguilla TaxID=7936 RepID=A0A9D3LRR0_ANGAN|nr:hypothetical protein ANANG_G00248060 [Anguilla anguilla]